MNKSILLSFELDGKEYVLANNRDVVRKAAEREPKAFDSLLKDAQSVKAKGKSSDNMSFVEMLELSENNNILYRTLFCEALVSGTPNVSREEANDVYEVLYYNIDAEDLVVLNQKLMRLINNTDFIKGSNQRAATVKMKF